MCITLYIYRFCAAESNTCTATLTQTRINLFITSPARFLISSFSIAWKGHAERHKKQPTHDE